MVRDFSMLAPNGDQSSGGLPVTFRVNLRCDGGCMSENSSHRFNVGTLTHDGSCRVPQLVWKPNRYSRSVAGPLDARAV